MIKKAAILSIGDEILLGQIVNTNSAWLSQKLTDIGVIVTSQITVGDEEDMIIRQLHTLAISNDLIIITGGLGPTDDDKTKSALGQYFGVGMKRDETSVNRIKTRLQSFMKDKITQEIIDLNLRQADIPANSIALHNPQGAAPGIWIENEGKVYISLPGVPFEVEAIMNQSGLDKIKERAQAQVHIYNLVVYNIAESVLSLQLRDFESSLDENTTLAYLPSTGYIILRLTRKGGKQGFESKCKELRELVDEVFLTEGDSILDAVMQILKQRNLHVTTAESCTGGGLASLICDVPGASQVFDESLVSYANEVKMKKLGVPNDVFYKYGAVSEDCVRYMAKGQLENTTADYSIAISGILGPSGGTIEKPVGTVFIAIANGSEVWVKKIKARWTRQVNKNYTIYQALIFLLEKLRD